MRITDLFVQALTQLNNTGELPHLDDATINLISHNISVLGHTWAFRRWYFAKNFTITQYTEQQTEFIRSFLAKKKG